MACDHFLEIGTPDRNDDFPGFVFFSKICHGNRFFKEIRHMCIVLNYYSIIVSIQYEFEHM